MTHAPSTNKLTRHDGEDSSIPSVRKSLPIYFKKIEVRRKDAGNSENTVSRHKGVR